MLFDETTESSLRPWLVRALQPICDADPGALTDYVIALLKHKGPEPEMRDLYISQLEEFLEKDAQSFVDSLLSALRTKSYLPYESIKPQGQDAGIPIPLDALMSSASPDRRRKRNPEDEEESERRPPKGPRLSNDNLYSRRPQGRGGFPINNGTFHGRGRRICRDYYNTGFCSRGASCQYSHGEDALVPPMAYPPSSGMMESMAASGVAPFMPMFPPFIGMGGGTYDPHESHMEMGQMHSQRQDGLPGTIPLSTSELPVIQDLTPRDPMEEANHGDRTLHSNGFTHNFGTPRRNMHMGMHDIMGAGRNYGRSGRGHFAGTAHSFRSGNQDDKTLVVEKIPEEKLNLGAVNDWFKRFGTVTNVAIDAIGGKALVSFSNHEEAHMAWKSEEAVFGNRFVKLFWHRPLEGQGTIGQKALAASANIIKAMGSAPPTILPPSSEVPSPSPPKHLPKQDSVMAAGLAARQQLLEKAISEQKVLLSRLTTASTPEEKRQLMERIKSLQDSVKPSTAVPSTSSLPDSQPKPILEKEGMDEELEPPAVQSPDDRKSPKTSEESKDTTVLQEKLAQLKAEASRLGLPEAEINNGSSPSQSMSSRPYRGRGFRARGYGRGGYARGGPPRQSMKLDNRPRKLLIQDIPKTEEATLAVRTYYQDMGNLESFWKEGPGQVVIQFWTRSAAELALASGSNIPSVGKVKISWHTGPAPSSTPIPVASSGASLPNSDGRKEADGDGQPDSYHVAADGERDDGGWGQAFEDEDEAEGRRRRSRSRSFS